MQKYLTPKHKSPIIRIRLEEHGTAVWNLIDGKRTVGEITAALAQHFNEEENYEYRITNYLSQLQGQGFIKIERSPK
jgi:superoxide dismutase